MADKVQVRLTRSLVGASERQKKIVHALGLKKHNQIVELPDSPATRGAVRKVAHLVEIIEA
ncbi:MAG: 50S ribosomal protein L30 [Fastidiosipilaceae bacterium]|nr:50S ribosomal protein L30 [Clostridiaceae bacterium]